MESRGKEKPTPCEGATQIFFGDFSDLRDEPDEERLARETAAEEVCMGCHKVNECLSFALRGKEKYGVWGGMSVGKRREFLKSIRSHRKSTWREAINDLEYLGRKSEVFFRKEEKRLKAIARKRQRAESGADEVEG